MLTEQMFEHRVVGIGYETVRLDHGSLALLLPMFEVAGPLSIQTGAKSLAMISGGKGIRLPGVSGVRRGRLTIIGVGIVRVGFGADVTIYRYQSVAPRVCSRRRPGARYDVDVEHRQHRGYRRRSGSRHRGRADLSARTPRLLTREHLKQMEPGSGIVDVAVDEGASRKRATDEAWRPPLRRGRGRALLRGEQPGALPHTPTYALTNATTAHALALVDHGWREAAEQNPALAQGAIWWPPGRASHGCEDARHGARTTRRAVILY